MRCLTDRTLGVDRELKKGRAIGDLHPDSYQSPTPFTEQEQPKEPKINPPEGRQATGNRRGRADAAQPAPIPSIHYPHNPGDSTGYRGCCSVFRGTGRPTTIPLHSPSFDPADTRAGTTRGSPAEGRERTGTKPNYSPRASKSLFSLSPWAGANRDILRHAVSSLGRRSGELEGEDQRRGARGHVGRVSPCTDAAVVPSQVASIPNSSSSPRQAKFSRNDTSEARPSVQGRERRTRPNAKSNS